MNRLISIYVLKKGHARTPTSRNLTSRQTAPKSFMRLSANSRKFPEFSHPLVTRGKGISLCNVHQQTII